ncbi:hypothetical protein, partial [Stenotrophomonas pictorum]|uniref:hypothetical protein n=1 Tax=Stenotrophomonas pictorum TaxID=86184 RepID=UPI001C44B5D6
MSGREPGVSMPRRACLAPSTRSEFGTHPDRASSTNTDVAASPMAPPLSSAHPRPATYCAASR